MTRLISSDLSTSMFSESSHVRGSVLGFDRLAAMAAAYGKHGVIDWATRFKRAPFAGWMEVGTVWS